MGIGGNYQAILFGLKVRQLDQSRVIPRRKNVVSQVVLKDLSDQMMGQVSPASMPDKDLFVIG